MRRGGWNNSTYFQRKFWGESGRGDFVLWMGTISRGWFLGGIERRSLVVFLGSKVEFFFVFQGICFWWYGMGWLEKGGGCSFFLFFFHNMVT